MRALLLGGVLVVFAACERIDAPPEPGPPLQPFAAVDWSAAPSEEVVLGAMVGTGGTAAQRAEVDQLARELLLPVWREARDSGSSNEYWLWAEDFGKLADQLRDPVKAFAYVAVQVRASSLSDWADALAVVRLHKVLWPREPLVDWERRLDVATVDARIRELEAAFERMKAFASRYVWPALGDAPLPYTHPARYIQRDMWMFETNLHIAKGGGYERSCGRVFFELRDHGFPTEPSRGWADDLDPAFRSP